MTSRLSVQWLVTQYITSFYHWIYKRPVSDFEINHVSHLCEVSKGPTFCSLFFSCFVRHYSGYQRHDRMATTKIRMPTGWSYYAFAHEWFSKQCRICLNVMNFRNFPISPPLYPSFHLIYFVCSIKLHVRDRAWFVCLYGEIIPEL